MPTDNERTAERFAKRLREELSDNLHSVVLYGSVARGKAVQNSDVDLLIVADDPSRAFDVAGDVAYELDWENGFTTLLVPIEYSPEQVNQHLRAGDPFMRRVLDEGKVLYDDGTVSISGDSDLIRMKWRNIAMERVSGESNDILET